MEFLTSENSTSTKKLKITLKDEDANVLSTGYLDQRVGNAILNTGSYAVARLNPGENIITDPITISVPSSAPYKVIIEAAIENTPSTTMENRIRSQPPVRHSQQGRRSQTSHTGRQPQLKRPSTPMPSRC